MVTAFLVAVVAGGQGVGRNDLGLGLRNIFTWKRGDYSRYTQSALVPIYDEAALAKYWANAMGQPAISAPRGIDWQRQMVVAIHAGERPSGGYTIDLAKSDVVNGVITFHIREHRPLAGSNVDKNASSPWLLVRLDKTTNQFRMDTRVANDFPGLVMGANGATVIRNGAATIIIPNGVTWSDEGWYGYYVGDDCGYDSPGITVISSSVDFERFWTKVVGQSLDSAPGGVNWSSERLLSLSLGPRPTAGYGLVVLGTRIEKDRGVIVAYERKPDGFAAARVTRPHTMIRVDRNVPKWEIELLKSP